MPVFRTTPSDQGPQDQGAVIDAYRDGRKDERAQGEREASASEAIAKANAPALKDAYERGRHEGANRRRGSPLFVLVALLAVVAVGIVIFLAVRQGSFAGGGQVVDQQIEKLGDTTSQAANAASNAVAAPQTAAPEAQPVPATK
jgi:hypothetical protein